MNNEQLHYLNAMDIPVWQLRDAVQAPKHTEETAAIETPKKQTLVVTENANAKIMIIGEALDEQGEPGLLLNNMLAAIGVQQHDIHLINFSTFNPPKIDDANQFTQHLQKQINLTQPSIIMVVGQVAAQHLLNAKETLENLRGKIHHYGEKKIPFIVTYDTAYLLRTPKDKRKAFEDLLFLQSALAS